MSTTSTPTHPRVLVHGSGAVGIVYVTALYRAGWTVYATCRSNYAAAKADGFHLAYSGSDQTLHSKPAIARSPEEAVASLTAADDTAVFDFVVVTTKSIPEAKTSETIAPAVTKDHTAIVLIQNGIGIEDEYAERFPENPLLSCVVFVPASQVKPGFVEVSGKEKLQIGPFPTSASSNPLYTTSGETLVHALQSANSPATWEGASIQELRWHKLLLNAAWNPVCALAYARDIGVLKSTPVASHVLSALTGEVVMLANMQGFHTVTQEAAKALLAQSNERLGTKGVEVSMLADVRTKRQMEVEVILGNPVRIARRLGLDVPRMELLYVLAKTLNESLQRRKGDEALTGLDFDN